MHAHVNPWLSEFLEERESNKKNNLRESMKTTTEVNTLSLPELEALVEKTGKQMVFFGEHRHEWGRADWEKRLDKLKATQSALDAALAASKARLETFGWTVTRNGLWQRVNRRAAEWLETNCEKVFISAIREANELLIDVPETEQAGLRRDRLEKALNDALAADCIERLSVACAEYLGWAAEVKNGTRVNQVELSLGNAA